LGKIAGNEAARKALLQEFDLGVPLKVEQQVMKMEVVSLQQGSVAAAGLYPAQLSSLISFCKINQNKTLLAYSFPLNRLISTKFHSER